MFSLSRKQLKYHSTTDGHFSCNYNYFILSLARLKFDQILFWYFLFNIAIVLGSSCILIFALKREELTYKFNLYINCINFSLTFNLMYMCMYYKNLIRINSPFDAALYVNLFVSLFSTLCSTWLAFLTYLVYKFFSDKAQYLDFQICRYLYSSLYSLSHSTRQLDFASYSSSLHSVNIEWENKYIYTHTHTQTTNELSVWQIKIRYSCWLLGALPLISCAGKWKEKPHFH